MKPEYEFNDSELFAGELDSIEEVLEREHSTKFGNQQGKRRSVGQEDS
jgi:hypothetical protein